MKNLLFDLPEDIQVKIIKMNPRPFDKEYKMKLHDSDTWWYNVVCNYRNPHFFFQNFWWDADSEQWEKVDRRGYGFTWF
jgi:hypothetical protein